MCEKGGDSQGSCAETMFLFVQSEHGGFPFLFAVIIPSSSGEDKVTEKPLLKRGIGNEIPAGIVRHVEIVHGTEINISAHGIGFALADPFANVDREDQSVFLPVLLQVEAQSVFQGETGDSRKISRFSGDCESSCRVLREKLNRMGFVSGSICDVVDRSVWKRMRFSIADNPFSSTDGIGDIEEKSVLFQKILFRIRILPSEGDLYQSVRENFGLLPGKVPGIVADGEFLLENAFVSVRFGFVHAGTPGSK